MKKLLIIILVIALLGFLLFACGDDEDYDEYGEYGEEAYEIWDEPQEELIGYSGSRDESWAIYWYLCGSDLESEAGAATEDLYEMLEVELPDNVQVVIQTGGAWQWMNDFVDPDVTERYLYSSRGLELVDTQPLQNMGEASAVADFLYFCQSSYPADKTMVIFWNHGGGSVSGVSFDENFGYDSLTLDELYAGFSSVYDLSAGPAIDVIGFDACLMATIDTAWAFSDIASYMVASEEMEPGIGWYYSGWLQELADDPGMDGARLGQHICDSYYSECSSWWLEDEVTLSVVDLSRLQGLMAAYENMGIEALSLALSDPSFFSDFGREAESSENYGGNTRDQGYSNLVDLGHLAQNCACLLPRTSEAVLEGLRECVLYNVSGPYRDNASGLSCYYSFNGDLEDFRGYELIGCSDSFKYLYDYGLEGQLPPEGMEYLSCSVGYEEEVLPEVPELSQDCEEIYPLYIDDEDYVTLELDMDTVNMLKGVYFQLSYLDPENDLMLYLGRDNNISCDWENGIFRDNFQGVWGAIDGHIVYMEVYYETEDYSSFTVPILLNGEEYNLRVIYDYGDGAYYILGARQGLDDTGMADKNLVQLRPGDEITTIHYAASMSGDDEFQPISVDSFTVTENTSFADADMGDGLFLMLFELVDAKNNSAYSEMISFSVEGDMIDIEILG